MAGLYRDVGRSAEAEEAEGAEVNAGLVPADYLLGFLGRGPATRMALVGCLMNRGYSYAQAESECGQAILALTKAGRIESCQGDVFRLTAKYATMESKRTAPTDRIPCHETTGKPDGFDEPIGPDEDGE